MKRHVLPARVAGTYISHRSHMGDSGNSRETRDIYAIPKLYDRRRRVLGEGCARALSPTPAHRPDPTMLRGCPAFHARGVLALMELDALPHRDATAAVSFLQQLAPMLAEDAADELRDTFPDRVLRVLVVPALDSLTKARPQLCPHARKGGAGNVTSHTLSFSLS